jgi:pimeloyl-ACP methyl ester carboxylesterase
MRRLGFLSFVLLTLFVPLPGIAIEASLVEQRRQLAESGHLLHSSSPALASSAPSLAEAIDVAPNALLASSLSGDGAASGALSNLGVIHPLQGSSFAVLSSGIVGSSSTEPGTDFVPGGTGGDSTVLTLTLAAPPGPGRLSFLYNFLSTEIPDFTGTIYNDTFTATLTDANGTRVVALASVNTSFFYPATASRAGGSGFDLFTPDPSGVDTEFGSGLPDAGLTGFMPVSVPFQSNGQITLRLAVADLGDGILDSAVVLDNLSVGLLEILDAVPDFLAGGGVTTDTSILASKPGRPREGAAADGVTRVLLRGTVPGPGNVTFSLEGGQAPDDGGLAAVGSNGRANSVTVPAVSTSAGYRVFAVYRSPDEFNRGGDQALSDRPITFKTVFQPAGGGSPVEALRPFKIVRPPLVFVHGLWSGPATWTFPLATDPRFVSTSADYESMNASHFAQNSGVVPAYVQKAIAAMNDRKYAAVQVDIAGHSMGGLLSRIWTTAGGYKRNDNFQQGDVHKLMTLDSPHTGSPLGNLLVTLRETPIIGSLVTSLANKLNKPIDRGAIDDLATGSPAIQAIGAAPVPGHALVGVGGSDTLTLIGGSLGAFYRMVSFFSNLDFFQGLQHDGVVGRLSQEGGLPDSATSVFSLLQGGVHTFNTGSTAYSNRLVELLNTDADNAAFAQFPAPSSLDLPEAADLQDRIRASLRAVRSVQPGVVITSPAPGTVITAGSTFVVTVEPLPGAVVEQVLVTGPGVAEIDAAAPFQVTIQVPEEAIGSFTLTAVGSNSSGDYYTSEDLQLQVTPSGALQSFAVIPEDPILLGPGDAAQIHALGTFADGVVRDLTGSAQGTEYLTTNPLIATVSAEGLVTAVAPGVVALIVRNGTFQDSVAVTVQGAGPAPQITSLTPGSAVAGSGGLTLVVHGSGFDASSSILWNGSPRPTTFVSATELRAEISAADLADEGPMAVNVVNTAPGGGTSDPATFNVTGIQGTTEIPTLSEWGAAGFAALLAGCSLLLLRRRRSRVS